MHRIAAQNTDSLFGSLHVDERFIFRTLCDLKILLGDRTAIEKQLRTIQGFLRDSLIGLGLLIVGECQPQVGA